LYRQAGFASTDRQLLTLRLADPTHAAQGPGADRPSPRSTDGVVFSGGGW
jgi:hypothetical protein